MYFYKFFSVKENKFTKMITALSMLIALILICGPLFAQRGNNMEDRRKEEGRLIQERQPIPTEGQVLRAIDEIISRGDNELTSFELVKFLASLSGYIDSIKTQKIANKIMNIPELKTFNEEYPKYAHETEGAKLRALGHMAEFSGVREYVLESLRSQIPQIRGAAARTLLIWGEWDLAAPVICEYEAYSLFQAYKDDRAIPLLEEAVKSGSWQGRIFAAAALFYSYGDSIKYPQVALDIILNAPINTDDEDINRAKYLALQQVRRFNLVEALPGLIRMAQDTARGISPTAVGYLVDLSNMGNKEAKEALIDICDNHADDDIREIARKGISENKEK